MYHSYSWHLIRPNIVVAAAVAAVAVMSASASAHPHVWVTVKSELIFAPDGSVTGVRHAWAFDDMFSTFAIKGLKSKTKGEFTREELAPLAETNVTSLKEYEYTRMPKRTARMWSSSIHLQTTISTLTRRSRCSRSTSRCRSSGP